MKNQLFCLFAYSILMAGITIVFSCGSAAKPHDFEDENILSAYDSSSGRSFTYSKYELPLSVDIFEFLESNKFPYNMLLMHKIKDQDKYFTDFQRALILGVYSSDLVYSAVYDKNQEAVEYFAVNIELAQKLNIQEGYNSGTLDRAYKNLGNHDSLSRIVGESYWKTCTVLEKSGRDNILPMIVTGSWIESMHILVRNTLGTPPGSKIFYELYKQQFHLENLVSYLQDAAIEIESQDSKSELVKITERLQIILQKFKQIDANNPQNLSLGQFKDVVFQVENLRNSIIE
jgi:hypothetical protein